MSILLLISLAQHGQEEKARKIVDKWNEAWKILFFSQRKVSWLCSKKTSLCHVSKNGRARKVRNKTLTCSPILLKKQNPILKKGKWVQTGWLLVDTDLTNVSDAHWIHHSLQGDVEFHPALHVIHLPIRNWEGTGSV